MNMGAVSAVVVGATGQTGQHLLQALLSSNHYAGVGEYGRRLTTLDKVPPTSKEKLEQHVIDFEKLDASGLGGKTWDVVFIALGTTRKDAGSAQNFVKIDREYVINAAKEAKVSQAGTNQRLVYLSSLGANPKSNFLYAQSKGLTEEGLARLGYQDNIIFRPALLTGTKRPEPRIGEKIYSLLTGPLSLFTNSLEIDVGTLGRAMAVAGKYGSDNLPPEAGATKVQLEDGVTYTVIGNAGAIALSKLEL